MRSTPIRHLQVFVAALTNLLMWNNDLSGGTAIGGTEHPVESPST
jgi:hypothetical protein